jgi:hypothetical protein
MLHASYQSHIGTDGYIAPDARPDDGIIWLLVIRAGASRSQLLQVVLYSLNENLFYLNNIYLSAQRATKMNIVEQFLLQSFIL